MDISTPSIIPDLPFKFFDVVSNFVSHLKLLQRHEVAWRAKAQYEMGNVAKLTKIDTVETVIRPACNVRASSTLQS